MLYTLIKKSGFGDLCSVLCLDGNGEREGRVSKGSGKVRRDFSHLLSVRCGNRCMYVKALCVCVCVLSVSNDKSV